MDTEVMLGAPAYAIYSAEKRKKRNRSKKKGKSNEEIIITEDEDCAIEEVDIHNLPSTSFSRNRERKGGKKKRKSFDNVSRQNNHASVEIIDIDENSDDTITIENECSKRKRKKRLNAVDQDDDEIICEYENGKINGTPLGKKSSKNIKYKTKQNIQKDDVVVNSVSDESEDAHDDDDDDDEEEEDDINSGDSSVEGRKLFVWLVNPVIPEDFFSNTWEKRPLHIKRGTKEYYIPIMSTAVIDKMLRNHNIQFTKNVDITSYTDGKRETHNPEGRALPSVVWDYYKNGCSVRLLNPQTFIPKLALLCTTLQDYFGCFVGANSYLTPPDSQGFAPHYDDIDAFILQVEGKKHWRLYAPKSNNEVLPRFSSGNFSQDEIGKPLMEVTLEPGDLLYFPRGTIHQANTVKGYHSLHITLSCYQRNTWGDLLEKVVSAALRVALEEDVEFRKGLPHNYLSYMGIVHSDVTSPERTAFIEKVKYLTGKLFSHAPVDAAVDQMGKQFMHDALPPILTPEEKECSAFGDGYRMEENGKLSSGVEFTLVTKVKLLRGHILRLVSEEDTIRIYHCADNSLEYHGNEPQFLEIPDEMAPAVEHLVRSYPEFVKISELPLEDDKQKITIVADLWDRGLLLTEGSLMKSE